MKTIQKKKFIDLFSGIGGFHAAAQRYGMECTFACDIDSHARKTYKSWYGIEPAADIIPYSEQLGSRANHSAMLAQIWALKIKQEARCFSILQTLFVKLDQRYFS